MVRYHAKSIKEVFSHLSAKEEGISQEEAEKRLLRYGYNEIKEIKPISPLKIFISQFKSFLIGILLLAVIINRYSNNQESQSSQGFHRLLY